jgi:lysine 2,3-aminomutase
MLLESSENAAGFSITQALHDLAQDIPRPDLQAGFYAEMTHLAMGLAGRALRSPFEESESSVSATGRAAAIRRSDELDRLWRSVEKKMSCYQDGLAPEARGRRSKRRAKTLSALGGTSKNFADWRWHIAQIARDAETLERMVPLSPAERGAIRQATRGKLPFGVTPYYESLWYYY